MSDPSDSAIGERLFDDFSPSTYEEWKEAAIASLKGAPFEKKVFTKTYEGIELKPIYMEGDIQDLPHLGSLPGYGPFARGIRCDGYIVKPWGISQEFTTATPEAFNQAIRYDLERGQTDLNLKLDPPSLRGIDPDHELAEGVGRNGLSLATTNDLAIALAGIPLDKTPVYIDAGAVSLPFLALLTGWLETRGQKPSLLKGCLGADPLGTMARTGTLPMSLDTAYDAMAAVLLWTKNEAPGLRTILVQAHPYHDAGAGAVQELAFALATGVSYLRAMMDRGVTIDDAAAGMQFGFSVGGHFFMEIAKLRAARILWSQIVEAFGGTSEAGKMKLHGRTSAWTKTTYDPYVNMLRNTTEAFSAVMGGVDSLHVAPFDEPVRPADEFSRRVSRNLQLLLKDECRFTHPIDPGGGSWYIEHLTDQVARTAWELFQQVEAKGGMYPALREGFPQQAAEETAEKRAVNLAVRKDVLVGINMYVNLKETRLTPDDTDYEAVKTARATEVQAFRQKSGQAVSSPSPSRPDTAWVGAAVEAAAQGATLGQLAGMFDPGETPSISRLRRHRAADRFERLRLNTEKIENQLGRPIQVFLANMGPVPQHKARADFATGFFEVGGFEVLGNNGFDTVEAASQAAISSNAPVVVICSTDQTYPEIVPDMTQRIKQARPDATVILAGKPAAEHEASYNQAGLDGAIFIRANCLDMLRDLQKKIGGIDG